MKLRKLRKLRQETSGRGNTTSYRVTTEIWRSNYNMREGHARVWVTIGKFFKRGVK